MRRFGAVLFLILLLAMVFVGCTEKPVDETGPTIGTTPSLVPPETPAETEGMTEAGRTQDTSVEEITNGTAAATEAPAGLIDSSAPKPEETQPSAEVNASEENPVETTKPVQENPQPAETAPEVDPGGLEIGGDVVVTIEDGQKVGGN